MSLRDVFDVVSKLGAVFGMVGSSGNGIRADVVTLKEEVAKLRERFDQYAASRSGYIEQLENHGRILDVIDRKFDDVERITTRNSDRIDELVKRVDERSDRIELVAKRGHDIVEEFASAITVLQVVCEKVKVKYPERRR